MNRPAFVNNFTRGIGWYFWVLERLDHCRLPRFLVVLDPSEISVVSSKGTGRYLRVCNSELGRASCGIMQMGEELGLQGTAN